MYLILFIPLTEKSLKRAKLNPSMKRMRSFPKFTVKDTIRNGAKLRVDEGDVWMLTSPPLARG